MKISFITTVFNEEKTIGQFIDSVLQQTKLPDEIVIVDGDSSDDTVLKIKNLSSRLSLNKTNFKLLVKKGNRSIGRNEAIKNATGEIIVCSDAGNILDKDWIKNIIEPFKDSSVDVVAGYYKGLAKNVFQKCLIPYVLVMEDKVNSNTFLPATRSVAFTKSIWQKIGGFDEKLSHNEDYAFAKKLKKNNAKIIFRKDAVVYWLPRVNLREAFYMFFRFAYGDAEAKIYRPKVLILFLRYILAIFILFLAIINTSVRLGSILALLLIVYSFWAIAKNYKYVREWNAIGVLPVLQFTADIAVLSGTVAGLLKIWDIQKTS